MESELRMHAERTPNPHSIKWVTNRVLVEEPGGVSFTESIEPDVSPLAARLLGVEGVAAVFLGSDFVTVTRDPATEWTELAPPIVAALKDWAATEAPALGPAWKPPARAEDDDTVRRIREILENEVRPYVERDGGEIVYAGFSDGVVQVSLRGACAGCPSSTITLKLAIEGRLKEAIPEVHSVVAV